MSLLAEWIESDIVLAFPDSICNMYFVVQATKCGDCLTKCLQDETCKTCLEKLTELDTRDQAASYRTIVSYESEALKDFSFCVFQKHNVFQCEATIPAIPKVTPMSAWRGKEMTEGAARSLLIGHLNDDKAPEVRSTTFCMDELGVFLGTISAYCISLTIVTGILKARYFVEGSVRRKCSLVSMVPFV